eukprot:scaffold17029_cov136-Skeletonema_marinoi.AAC.1
MSAANNNEEEEVGRNATINTQHNNDTDDVMCRCACCGATEAHKIEDMHRMQICSILQHQMKNIDRNINERARNGLLNCVMSFSSSNPKQPPWVTVQSACYHYHLI